VHVGGREGHYNPGGLPIGLSNVPHCLLGSWFCTGEATALDAAGDAAQLMELPLMDLAEGLVGAPPRRSDSLQKPIRTSK
jgi:hypothetical protein